MTKAYPIILVLCLKRVHLTVDGWRPDENDQGWKRRCQEIEVLQRNVVLDDYDHWESPDFIQLVPRYPFKPPS